MAQPRKGLIRLLTVILFGILFLWPVRITGTPVAAQDPGEAGCFLWEVVAETGPSYLLGSVHLGTDDLYPLPAKIEEAYESSSFLVVEANILAVEEEELFSLMHSFAINPGFRSVEQYISEEEYAMLQQVLAELGLDIAQLSFCRPWYLANLITSLRFINAGFNPDLGIDVYFLQKAGGNKDILELESLEFQFMLFSELPPELEHLYLREALTTSREEFAEKTRRLLEAWKTGDTGLLEEISFSKEKDAAYQEFYKRLISQRNVAMVAKIEEYMKKGTAFIVVGAAHLVGEDGIVELLRKRGYTVRQL